MVLFILFVLYIADSSRSASARLEILFTLMHIVQEVLPAKSLKSKIVLYLLQ